ncbi:MAG: DMT family transporter [Muribaculaceae bacterium]|nr:DMT family transporter [Muribaculaceae bacterium]
MGSAVGVTGKERMKGHLALLFANSAWGLMAPISKGLLNLGVISPLALSGVRIMGGALLFWLVSALTPDSVIKKEKIEPGDFVKIFFAGLLVIAANQILVVQGMSYTSPVDAAVVCSTTPIFTLVLATIILKEKLTSFRIGGVALGFAAVVVFSLWGEADLSMNVTNPILGNSFCILAQMCGAAYLVVFGKLISKYSPFTMMKWMMLMSAVVIFPFTIGDILEIDWTAFPVEGFLELAYIVVLGSCLCYLMIPFAQRRLKPTVIAMYNYLQPVVATLVSVVIGMAMLDAVKAGSALLIFLAVWMVSKER